MKLVRFGPPGREKPGIIDSAGRIRDLSGVVDDIAGETLGPKGLAKIRKAKVDTLPVVRSGARLGPCVGGVGNFIAIGLNYADHAAEPAADPQGADPLQQGAVAASSARTTTRCIPKGSQKTDWEVELGDRHRHARHDMSTKKDALDAVAGYCVCQRRVGARVPARARRPVDQGQGRRDLRPARALAGDRGTRSRTRRSSACGSTSTASGARTAPPRRWSSGSPTSSATSRSSWCWSRATSSPPARPPGVGLGMKPPRFLKAGDVVTARHRRARRAAAEGGEVQDMSAAGPVDPGRPTTHQRPAK